MAEGKHCVERVWLRATWREKEGKEEEDEKVEQEEKVDQG